MKPEPVARRASASDRRTPLLALGLALMLRPPGSMKWFEEYEGAATPVPITTTLAFVLLASIGSRNAQVAMEAV